MKNWTGGFLSRLYMKIFFKRHGITRQHVSMEFLMYLHNFPLLVEIENKIILPNSIFKFNSSFLVLYINSICEIKICEISSIICD